VPTTALSNALIAASLVIAAWNSPLVAQWVVTVEVGSDRFWGGAVESSNERRSLRPYRPTSFGLGMERRGGRLGAGLRLRHASAGLALEGADAVAAVKGVLSVYTAAPEIVYHLASVGTANQLVLHGGPLFEVWKVSDEGSQARIGLHAALSFRVPLGGRFAGSLTAGGALTPSPFTRDQLDGGFERRALWRRRIAGGLEYRL
jgi:hypothetical protein